MILNPQNLIINKKKRHRKIRHLTVVMVAYFIVGSCNRNNKKQTEEIREDYIYK